MAKFHAFKRLKKPGTYIIHLPQNLQLEDAKIVPGKFSFNKHVYSVRCGLRFQKRALSHELLNKVNSQRQAFCFSNSKVIFPIPLI